MRIARLAGLFAAGALALAVAAPVGAAGPAKLTYVPTANDGDTPTAGKAWVRVLHGSPDAPSVDVFVGADLASATKVAALSGVTFGKITDYFETDPGTVAVKVCATADNTVCPIEVPSLELKADTKYTIAASGLLASIKATPFVDAPAADREGAQVRVVHLSADTPAVDVLTQDGKPTGIAGLTYPNATEYVPLPAGSYDLKVCASADKTVCPLDLEPLTLENGKAYSVFAVGSLAATVGTPSNPLPPTDTVGAQDGGSSNGLGLLALAVAGIAAFGLALRFAPARIRR